MFGRVSDPVASVATPMDDPMDLNHLRESVCYQTGINVKESFTIKSQTSGMVLDIGPLLCGSAPPSVSKDAGPSAALCRHAVKGTPSQMWIFASNRSIVPYLSLYPPVDSDSEQPLLDSIVKQSWTYDVSSGRILRHDPGKGVVLLRGKASCCGEKQCEERVLETPCYWETPETSTKEGTYDKWILVTEFEQLSQRMRKCVSDIWKWVRIYDSKQATALDKGDNNRRSLMQRHGNSMKTRKRSTSKLRDSEPSVNRTRPRSSSDKRLNKGGVERGIVLCDGDEIDYERIGGGNSTKQQKAEVKASGNGEMQDYLENDSTLRKTPAAMYMDMLGYHNMKMGGILDPLLPPGQLEFTIDYIYHKIWDETGTSSKHSVSIWRPKPRSEYVFFGDHACEGHEYPANRCVVARDAGDSAFVKPSGYVLVWKQKKADHPLWVWRPVPPSDEYYALGDVVTTTDTAPEIKQLRCVHRDYLIHSKNAPILVWNDKGTGGIDGAFWRMRGLNTLHVSGGSHDPESGYSLVFHHDGFPRKLDISSIPLRVTDKFGYRLLWKTQDKSTPFLDRVHQQYKVYTGADTEAVDQKEQQQSATSCVWRPILPGGCVMFGDFASEGDHIPSHSNEKVLVCYDHWMLREPIGYRLILYVPKTPEHNALWVWRPITPFSEYVSLGDVCTTKSDPPPLSAVRCIPKRFTTQSRSVKEGCQVWADRDKGYPVIGSLWRRPGTSNCFRAIKGSHSAPHHLMAEDQDGEYDLIHGTRSAVGEVTQVERTALELLDDLIDCLEKMNTPCIMFSRTLALVKPLQLLLAYFSLIKTSSSCSALHDLHTASRGGSSTTTPATPQDTAGAKTYKQQEQQQQQQQQQQLPMNSKNHPLYWPRPLVSLSSQSSARISLWLQNVSFSIRNQVTEDLDTFLSRSVLLSTPQLLADVREIHAGHVLVGILPEPNMSYKPIVQDIAVRMIKPLLTMFSVRSMTGVSMTEVWTRMVSWLRRMLNKEVEYHRLFDLFPLYWDFARVLARTFCHFAAKVLVELHRDTSFVCADIYTALVLMSQFEEELPQILDDVCPTPRFQTFDSVEEMHQSLYGTRDTICPMIHKNELHLCVGKHLGPILVELIKDCRKNLAEILDQVSGEVVGALAATSASPLSSAKQILNEILSNLKNYMPICPPVVCMRIMDGAVEAFVSYSKSFRRKLKKLFEDEAAVLDICGCCVSTVNSLLFLQNGLQEAAECMQQMARNMESTPKKKLLSESDDGPNNEADPHLSSHHPAEELTPVASEDSKLQVEGQDPEQTAVVSAPLSQQASQKQADGPTRSTQRSSRKSHTVEESLQCIDRGIEILLRDTNDTVRYLAYVISVELSKILKPSDIQAMWSANREVIGYSPLVDMLSSAMHSEQSLIWKVRELLPAIQFSSVCSWVVTYFAESMMQLLPYLAKATKGMAMQQQQRQSQSNHLYPYGDEETQGNDSGRRDHTTTAIVNATLQSISSNARQAQLDTQGIRNVFLSLPVRTRFYRRHVQQAFLLFENSAKCMACSTIDDILPTFGALFPQGNVDDLKVLLQLKGVSDLDCQSAMTQYCQLVPLELQTKRVLILDEMTKTQKQKIQRTLKSMWNFISKPF